MSTIGSYKIRCVGCGKTFDGYAPRQADGCAAELDLKESVILGHYGSSHDITRYRVTSPLNVSGSGVVCDGCVDSWLDDSFIVEDGEYYDWQ